MKERSYRYPKDEPEKIDEFISGSYDRFVQLERRNLLVVSVVIVFSAVMGVSPEKSSFAGISFSKMEVGHFYMFLAFLAAYFLGAFLVYGYPSYRKARKEKKKLDSDAMVLTSNVPFWHLEWGRIAPNFRYQSWLFIHYYLPVILGLISISIGFANAI